VANEPSTSSAKNVLMDLLNRSSDPQDKKKTRTQVPSIAATKTRNAKQLPKRGPGKHAGKLGFNDKYFIYAWVADTTIKVGFSSSDPWTLILQVTRMVPKIDKLAVFFVEGIVIFMFVYLSVDLFVCLFIRVSVCMSVCLSFCLSVCKR
jgi:hypothetical protein